MERIILIETSTSLCSVALAEDGAVTAYRESSAHKAHASLTAVFVQEVLQERGVTLSDCDAVCVSKGPGSYTGLRVGVSTAKGLCFGSGLPLIAVGTLDTLVTQAEGEYKYIIPMIDARRMEVYACVFENGVQITETEPGFKGDTATGATKPAIVETGATVYVPLFVEQGDVIKIDTRTGEYLSRV